MKYGNKEIFKPERKNGGGMKRTWIWIAVGLIAVGLIAVAAAGCVYEPGDSIKNDSVITTESTPEQKLPAYNETKPLEFNDTFETWSRGYDANYYEKQPYFKVITNYSEWIAFINEQRKEESERLEGTLFPGPTVVPRTIEPVYFNNYFIIAAMMGYKTKLKPEIQIKNISRLNNVINVTIWLYNPSFGETAMSSPYHIVIVKRELLMVGNSTFIFIDTEGKLLGKVEVNE